MASGLFLGFDQLWSDVEGRDIETNCIPNLCLADE